MASIRDRPQLKLRPVIQILRYSEPIGGSKPQISEDSQLKRLSRHENQIMAFVCPAQGFPQPSFRLKFVSSNNIE